MHEILVAGAGVIGREIAALLAAADEYRVTIADGADAALQSSWQSSWADGVATLRCDLSDRAALDRALIGKHAVIAATPYDVTPHIARAAVAAGVHYFDLTEDEDASRLLRDLGASARGVLAPQCGLAPGFVSI
ncbi:MAG: saccharopine dehydrogenase NADP-binding domain-containing protein, partial [Pseudomonadota bacterium]